MWYITTDIDDTVRTGGLGGLGHMYYLYVTSIMIGLIFDIEHVYYPFRTAGTQKHKKAASNETLNWDDFINFKKGEKHIKDISYPRVMIRPVPPFGTITFEYLHDFFSRYSRGDDYVFCVGNCNRILPGEFHSWCVKGMAPPDLYDRFIEIIREKCIYKAQTVPGLVVIQIRRGDAIWEPLSYYTKVLSDVMKSNAVKEITVLSLGTEEQMAEIREHFKDFNVKYLLNYDTIKSFKLMMDAEVLIGGGSSFPKIAGLYSDGKKYMLPPYVKGVINEIPTTDSWVLNNLKDIAE